LLQDLLAEEERKLEIKQGSNGTTVVPDLSVHPVKSVADCVELMAVGEQHRAKGQTNMNEHSRSAGQPLAHSPLVPLTSRLMPRCVTAAHT
jgi:hypothetical protein